VQLGSQTKPPASASSPAANGWEKAGAITAPTKKLARDRFSQAPDSAALPNY